jgi:cobalt/nickel transport system permease protein
VHFHLADRYQPGSSRVHRLDPRAKILIVTGFILGLSLSSPGAWFPFLMYCVLILLAAVASGLGPGFTVRRSFVALPFVLAALSLPFTVPGPTLFTVPGLGWAASLPGTIRFASIVLRTWLAVQAAILLAATTPFPDLLWGMSRLGVPAPLVAVVGFMYRYLFLAGDEALRMIRARTARSAWTEGQRRPSIVWQGRVTGNMVGSLFLRSIERSERVYDAMLARGYDGQVRSLAHFHLRRPDVVALAATVAIVGGLVAWSLRG